MDKTIKIGILIGVHMDKIYKAKKYNNLNV